MEKSEPRQPPAITGLTGSAAKTTTAATQSVLSPSIENSFEAKARGRDRLRLRWQGHMIGPGIPKQLPVPQSNIAMWLLKSSVTRAICPYEHISMDSISLTSFFQVEPVPAPAGHAVLGLAGLVGRGRRRR